jgi:phage repressor protein C with HTH and peptisase S24 domain
MQPTTDKGDEMGWASEYIARLQNGESVQFRPRGNSMQGKIESGQLCSVEPVVPATLGAGDIVLCKVNGKQYLHLVKAIHRNRRLICSTR